MSAVLDDAPAQAATSGVLEAARKVAHQAGLPFAGGVTPPQAWALVQQGQAVLVDVRSAEERKFVGQVPGSVQVAWAPGTALTHNPRFTRELEAEVGKQDVVLLLCRSGKRSALAAGGSVQWSADVCIRRGNG